jgi:hypothetical protein
MRRLVALSVAIVAVMSGCSGGERHVAPPTTTLPDPDVVPAVITPAYVDAVFVVLNHIYGNASRTLRAERAVTSAVKVDLRAIFNDPAYGVQLQAAQAAVAGSEIDNVRLRGGDAVTTVTQLLTASPTCIFIRVTTDLSKLELKVPAPPAAEYFEFAPKQPGNDPTRLNPTPWAIAVDEAFTTPTTAKSTCVTS